MHGVIAIRALASQREYDDCAALQREIWGADFTDVVPPSILQVSQRIGGVSAGAFDGETLLGFVFGMTGVRGGQIVHWSDMLAVRAHARGRGVATGLKTFQRQRAREAGAVAMYWTFDPLVARNAHFNFNTLRARADEYVVNMYGVTRSALHGGVETDRWIMRWSLVESRGVGSDEGSDGGADEGAGYGGMTLEIPVDFEAMVRAEPEEAVRLRHESLAAFTGALGRGYCVAAFHFDRARGRAWYSFRRVAP